MFKSSTSVKLRGRPWWPSPSVHGTVQCPKRALPQSALTKAALVEVLGCRMQSRETPDPDVRLKVWVGFLKKSFEKNVHFGL